MTPERSKVRSQIDDGHTDLIFEYLSGHAPNAAELPDLIRTCAFYGDVSAMKHLLANGASVDSLGSYPLNTAAFHGHWRLCQFLIARGVDVDERVVETGETPLHSALCHPHQPAYDNVVKVLLGAGGNPNAATIPGMRTDSFTQDARTKGETPLHRAAAFGTVASLQMLLDKGAVIDVRDANGETPLAWASWHRRSGDIVHRLCYGQYARQGPPPPDCTHRADRGVGWGGMAAILVGKPHV